MTETPEVQDFAEFEQGVEAELKAAPRSKFGILQWADQEKRSGKSYEWQVYGLLPMNQTIPVSYTHLTLPTILLV